MVELDALTQLRGLSSAQVETRPISGVPLND